MALTAQQKTDVRTAIMRALAVGECGAVTKAELLQLISETDDWIEANATAYNLAISASIRNKFTSGEKARILAAVALKRYGG